MLNKRERGHTISETELLATVYGFKEFRLYLKGREVTVLSDHKALSFLKDYTLLNDID